jgi:hypothetical protein
MREEWIPVKMKELGYEYIVCMKLNCFKKEATPAAFILLHIHDFSVVGCAVLLHIVTITDLIGQ